MYSILKGYNFHYFSRNDLHIGTGGLKYVEYSRVGTRALAPTEGLLCDA